VQLERELARAVELPPLERGRLALRRYAAIYHNANELHYLGKTFHYDSRLMPALMPSYLAEIRRLDRIVGLETSSVLDVGANVGQFAATLSWRFPEARVWSFEPNRDIYPLLERNAAQSPNWNVLPWGIAERDEEVNLWAVDGKSAQGSVFRQNATAGLRAAEPIAQIVSMRCLSDEVIEEIGIPSTVDLVKIDVEGAEDAALKGLVDLRWRYLAIETSLAREGGITVDGAVELVDELWGFRPAVVWRGHAARGQGAVDAILACTRRAQEAVSSRSGGASGIRPEVRNGPAT